MKTFSIDIIEVRSDAETGVVSEIVWNAYLVENNLAINGSYYTAVLQETTILPNAHPDNHDFIPLSEIDEKTAKNWVNKYHDLENLMDRLEEIILSYKKVPDYVSSVPWDKD